MSVKVLHKYIYQDSVNETEFKDKDKTLLEMVVGLGYIPDLSSVAFIDDEKEVANPVPLEMLGYIKPKNGSYVIVQAPAGDTVKQLLVAVISVVAVVYGQPALATALGGGSFATAASSLIVGVGISALQSAVTSYKAPTVSGGQDSSPTLSISGTQNQVNAGQPVPYHIGTNRFIPPLAAQPIRDANGKDVYLNQVFIVGYAPVIVSELKIGDTAIENFSDIDIQINDGYSSHDQITAIQGDVTTQSGLSRTLSYNSPVIVTGGELSEKASLVLAFNRGLVSISDSGKYESRTVNVSVEYRPVGGGDWANARPFEYYNATFRSQQVDSYQEVIRVYSENETVTTIVDDWFIDFNNLPSGLSVGKSFTIGGSSKNSGIYTALSISGNAVKIGRVAYNRIRTRIEEGKTASNESNVSVSYVEGDSVAGNYSFTDATAEATYRTIDIPSLPKNQYEFRLTRTSTDSTSNRINDEVSLVELKTTQLTNADGSLVSAFPSGYAYIGIRIKATDQLNGNINQLSCKVQSVPVIYNSSTSSYQTSPENSGNNAWEYLTLLKSVASKKIPLTENIDMDSLAEWANRCNELVNGKPRHRINHVVDYAGAQSDVLQKIASIGRASPSEIDGVKSIIMDVGGKPSTQKFTNSNSSGFSATKSFAVRPDAFKCSFVNPDKDWTIDYINIKRDDNQEEESGDVIEELDCVGITDFDELYRYAKFAHAQIELRPEEYTLSTGIESIVSTRGDVVTVSHDKIQGNVTSSRISSFSGNIITLDAPFSLDDTQSYVLSIRHSTANQSSITYDVDSIDFNTVTLFVDTATIPDLSIGDIAIIGNTATTVDSKYIIKSIRNSGDLNATITMVDYADPDIYSSEDGIIVDYNPEIYKSSIKELATPDKPIIVEIYADERAIVIGYDKTLKVRAAVEVSQLSDSTKPTPHTVEISYRVTGSDGYYKYETYPVGQSLIYANDVSEGVTYDIRIRNITEQGVVSEFVEINSLYIVGKTTPPDDVTGFTISSMSGNAILKWEPNSDIDLLGYIIRYSSSPNPTWGGSIIVTEDIGRSTSQISITSNIGSYLIKAKDSGGRESVNATIVNNNTQSLENFNVVEQIDESTPEFQGVKTDTEVYDGKLRLKADNTIGDWPSLSDVRALSIGSGGYRSQGTYLFSDIIDLQNVFSARLTADLVATGIRATNTIGSWETLASVTSLGGGSDDKWAIMLEVSITQDDPAIDNWSEYGEFVAGDVTGRAFRFRMTLFSYEEVTTPEVRKLIVTVDMPDRVSGEENLLATVGGVTIAYQGGAFNAVPSVVANGEGLDTGDYHRITNKNETDFTIEFFNSSNVSIERTFDYLAKGYGNEQ